MSTSGVGRKDPKVLSRRRTDRAEVALVECEDVEGVVAGGEDSDRCVGQADAEGAIFRDEVARLLDVIFIECRQFVRSPADLGEKERFGVDAAELLNEEIGFGENKRRNDSRRRRTQECLSTLLVPVLIGEHRGENAARVDENHRPKLSRRASTFSAIVGSPRPASISGIRGTGAPAAIVAWLIASRITSASDFPLVRATLSTRFFNSSGR